MRIRSVFGALMSLTLTTACAQSPTGGSGGNTLVAPTKDELAGYNKKGYLSAKVGNGGFRYLGVDVARTKSISLDRGIYATVTFDPNANGSGSIAKDYRIPSGALNGISDELIKTAIVYARVPSASGTMLELAEDVAERTICVGRTARPSDIASTRYTNPNDIAKIRAANSGQVLGANTSGLNLKGSKMPVVDYSGHFGRISVRLKC